MLRAGPRTPTNQPIVRSIEAPQCIVPSTPAIHRNGTDCESRPVQDNADEGNDEDQQENDEARWSARDVVAKALELCKSCGSSKISGYFTASMTLMDPAKISSWGVEEIKKGLAAVWLFGEGKTTSTLIACYNAGSLMTKLKALTGTTQKQISIMLRCSTSQVSRCMKLFNLIENTKAVLFLYACQVPWGWVRDNINELEFELGKCGDVFKVEEN
jgi:hypothetical protein